MCNEDSSFDEPKEEDDQEIVEAPGSNDLQDSVRDKSRAELEETSNEKGGDNVRLLTLFWCLWLLGAWSSVALFEGAAGGVRWMVFASLIGLMAVWPAYRLSNVGNRRLIRKGKRLVLAGVVGEWLCLIAILQAVVWPLQITGDWYLDQTLLVDSIFLSWSLLTAAIVAWGCLTLNPLRRTIAMLLCIFLLVGGVLLEWLVGAMGSINMFSPFEILWVASRTSPATSTAQLSSVWGNVGGVFAVAILLWLFLFVSKRVCRL